MKKTPLQRLLKHTEKTTTCWNWTASTDSKGYGQIEIENVNLRAHRLAYMLLVGPIPQGIYVLHKCDNPRCVNPQHLFLGTQLDNIRDMIQKGRNVPPPILNGERNPSHKLTHSEALAIFESAGLHDEISKRYDVSRSLVGAIKSGMAWRHIHLAKRKFIAANSIP